MFAKKSDDKLAGLVKKIDDAVKKNEEKKLAAVINFFGDDPTALAERVQNFAKKHKFENVALVVTADTDNFKVNTDAEVTVMHYVGKTVKSNHAVAEGDLDAKAVKSIIEGINTILGDSDDEN